MKKSKILVLLLTFLLVFSMLFITACEEIGEIANGIEQGEIGNIPGIDTKPGEKPEPDEKPKPDEKPEPDEKTEFKVTFNVNGGKPLSLSTATVKLNAEFKFSVPEFDGYDFIGWEIDEKIITDKDGVSLKKWNFSSDKTAVAKWKAKEYFVKLIVDGGDCERLERYTYGVGAILPIPTRNGCTFDGWFESNDYSGKEVKEISKTDKGKKIFFAKWIRNNYNVTLNANGGECDKLDGYTYGEEIILPIPTKVGFTFGGWFDNKEFDGLNITEITRFDVGDKELFAKWTVNVYNITLESNGGICDDLTSYTYGIGATLPIPKRHGYTFKGWFDNKEFNGLTVEKIEANEMGDKQFFAKWSVNTYKVILNTNGGECENLTSYTYGVGAILPIPKRSGFDFAGWYDNKDLVGDRIIDIRYYEFGDKEYFAKWSNKSYSISLYTNDGECEPLYSYTYGKETVLPVPTKVGHTFLGWYESSDFAGAPIDKIKSTDKGDKQFFAKWKINTYKVTLHTNGGICDELTSYTYGIGANLPKPTKVGYNFAGWYDNKDFMGVQILDIQYNDIGDKEYFAKWTSEEYSIILYTNGGECEPLYSYSYGKETILPVPKLVGHTFLGWYDSWDFLGSPIERITETDTGNKQFYAKWQINTYKVTLHTNGGICDELTSYTYGYGATLPIPTRNGYDFAGWFDNSAFGGDAVVNIESTETENKTFYAKWTVKTYKVKLNFNGGVGEDLTEYTYGIGATLPIPTRFGYTFGGWYEKSYFIYDPVTEILQSDFGDKVFYAKWIGDTFRVTLNSNGTQCNKLTGYRYGIGATLPNLSKNGFEFLGWFESSDFKGERVWFISSEDRGDKTYYAKWVAETYTITLHKNGGVCEDLTSYTYGVGAKLPVPTRVGYDFDGWFYSSDFSGIRITEISKTDMYNQEFFAKWIAKKYTVTLNKNGGTCDDLTQYTYAEGANLPVPTKTGYTFKGWYENSYFTGLAVSKIGVEDKGNKQFYAKWQANTYTVSFDTHGGEEVKSITVTYDSEYTISAVTQNAPYIFGGWYTEIGGGGSKIDTRGIWNIGENITLHAYWLGSDGFEYIEYNNLFCVSKYSGKDKNVIIQPYYRGIKVTGIYNSAFSGCTSLESVLIPEGIIDIGELAFYQCTSLESIVIPGSVNKISYSTFNDCVSLKNVTIGNGVECIGIYAFNNCVSLRNIQIPNSVTKIESNAFFDCRSLKNVIIGNGIENIDEGAFSFCNILQSVYFNGTSEEWNSVIIGGNESQEIYSATVYFYSETEPETSGNFWHFVGVDNVSLPWGAEYDENGFEYILKGSEYEVFGYHGTSHIVIIPDTFKGLKVTSIGNKAFARTKIVIVKIGDNVKTVNEKAFMDCPSLQKVVIPTNITKLERTSFSGSRNIKEVYYKGTYDQWKSILAMDSYEVKNANRYYYSANQPTSGGKWHYVGLERIPLPWDCDYDENGLEYILKGSEYEVFGYHGASNIVTIPDTFNNLKVTSVAFYCFRGLEIEKVYIGNNIVDISTYAFDNCTKIKYNEYKNGLYLGNESNPYLILMDTIDEELTYFVIHDKTKVIAYKALCYYNKLVTIVIPNTVKVIGFGAFESCEHLKFVYYTGTEGQWNSISIDKGNFNDNNDDLLSATRYYYSGKQPTTTGNFWHYIDGIAKPWGYEEDENGLEYVLKGSEYEVFSYHGKNKEIIIPDTFKGLKVTSIRNECFKGLDITKVTIGNNIKIIGDYAFYRCNSLQNVEIGNGVTTIGDSAFDYCDSLQSVVIGNSVTEIVWGAFSFCDALKSVYYKGDIKSWLNIKFGDWDSNPCSNGAQLYIGDKLLENLVIPYGVTTIGDYAFEGCNSLQSVVIPDSITTIGGHAFPRCDKLKTVYYKGDIKGWLNIKFSSNPCSNGVQLYIDDKLLENLVIPDGVTTIGGCAFSGCNSLQSVEIGNSVTTIGDYAFSGCSSLQSVVIGNGVTTIGYSTFYNYINLKAIYYKGTAEQWNSILIDNEYNNNDALLKATRYYYSESQPKPTGNFWHYVGVDNIAIPWGGDYDENGFEYILKGSEYEVFGYHGTSKEIIIPDTFKGLKVTSVRDKCFKGLDITKVVIGNNIKTIGFSAFYGCRSLKSVVIGNNVTTIGESAFYGCRSLQSAVIPDSVTTIGQEAFYGCRSLKSVVIGNSVTTIVEYAFYNCDNLKTVYYKGTAEQWNSISIGSYNGNLTSVPRYYYSETQPTATGDFWHYVGVDNIALPWGGDYDENGLEYILKGSEYEVFSYHGTSKEIIIPDTFKGLKVTSIRNECFKGLDITKVTIGNNIKTIGSSAFKNYTSLQIVVIPDSVITIGDQAFDGCTSLQSVEIGNSVTTIGDYAFSGCNSLQSVVIGNSVTTIGGCAFSGCNSLQSVVIGNSVTTIGDYAFSGCRSLKSVVIGNSVTTIGSSAFYGCRSLKSVVIGNSVTTIGWHAFDYCNKLKTVYYQGTSEQWNSISISSWNDSLTSATLYYYSETQSTTGNFWHYVGGIAKPWGYEEDENGFEYILKGAEYEVFGYHGTSKEIIIPDTFKGLKVTSIRNECFKGLDITKVTIGNNIKTIGSSAFYGCRSLKSVVIGNSVTTIGSSAFSGCNSLQSVEIGNSVTTIGDSAFHGCTSLQSVVIGNSVTTIGSSAFYGCTSLQIVVIPDSVTTIGYSAFYGCDNLKYNEYKNALYLGNETNPYLVLVKAKDTNIVDCIINSNTRIIYYDAFYSCTSLKSVVIGNSVTTIGSWAFYDCTSLKSVVIGNSVKTIGSSAFYRCIALKSVVIGNSVTTIGEHVFYDCFSLKTVYYKGTAEQWDSISIGSYNNNLTYATRYYYSETQPGTVGNFWHYVGGKPTIW